MDGQNQENLKDLFATFFDAEQAEECIEDFRKAEQMLCEHPAPDPEERLIAHIKAEMGIRLGSRKAKHFRRRLYEAAGVAAAMIVLSIVGLHIVENPTTRPTKGVYTASLLPTALWESDNIVADDADLAFFTAEIEQIEYEVHTMQSGEEPVESETSVTELEMELAEINSDFWKG